jgi:glycosyltransferase involved in cell wall biosynthesis
MCDCGRVPTLVVEHGVLLAVEARFSGELARGVTSINHLERRGRRLGADVFARWREGVPIDLFGMDAERSGGSGELPYADLMRTLGRYRFYAHPVRYTSLALAVCEAMTIGLPVIGLGTTELARVIEESRGGHADTRVDALVDASRRLLRDPAEALELGRSARAYARERFGIERFVRDWNAAFDALLA